LAGRRSGRATPSLHTALPTAPHRNNRQRPHLSIAKQCLDEAGHLYLRPISVPVGFGFIQKALPNAEAHVLRFAANYWLEHLGDRLQEIRLMGERGRDAPNLALQPGKGAGKPYSIAVLVADDAGDVQTNSEFHKALNDRINQVARLSNILQTLHCAIKCLGSIDDLTETTLSFQKPLDQARRILWRIPTPAVLP